MTRAEGRSSRALDVLSIELKPDLIAAYVEMKASRDLIIRLGDMTSKIRAATPHILGKRSTRSMVTRVNIITGKTWATYAGPDRPGRTDLLCPADTSRRKCIAGVKRGTSTALKLCPRLEVFVSALHRSGERVRAGSLECAKPKTGLSCLYTKQDPARKRCGSRSRRG